MRDEARKIKKMSEMVFVVSAFKWATAATGRNAATVRRSFCEGQSSDSGCFQPFSGRD